MRKAFYLGSLLVFLAGFIHILYGGSIPIWLGAIVGLLFGIGLSDIFQTRHAIKKNFPIIGHFRYMLEAIRPEIQQYFIESNTDGVPINRNHRSVVYQRSKKELQVQPFGTQEDLYADGAEWVCHSMFPKDVAEDFDRVKIGSSQCSQPYNSSIFNISAMSYGSLSENAVAALNQGAAKGGFSHNTGEGGISPYHQMGGDIVWQIGTGYFGCRTLEGDFCEKTFAEKAIKPEVKMIEIKLSQGAKPGKGGMLLGVKVTPEIATIRGVRVGKDVMSPPSHSAFSDARGLLEFIKKLRDLSGGKPVGFKLCVGNKEEFLDIVQEIKNTKIIPDFISVDGAEGGTGAAPLEFANAVGMPLKDGLTFVYKTLKAEGLIPEIRIIAAGKALTGFHLIRCFGMGADVVNSARGMMLALGCIQALRCHSNHCPVGITTNNKELVAGLHVPSKAERVANYHSETIKAVHTILVAMGKRRPCKVEMNDIYQRQNDGTYKTFAEIY
ncbi:MAG: FMN-binding glutamate synthase family protein [Pseudomonadota bacterium]